MWVLVFRNLKRNKVRQPCPYYETMMRNLRDLHMWFNSRLPVLLVDFFMLCLLSYKKKKMALFCSWECCEDKYFKRFLGTLLTGMELWKYLKLRVEIENCKFVDCLHSSWPVSWFFWSRGLLNKVSLLFLTPCLLELYLVEFLFLTMKQILQGVTVIFLLAWVQEFWLFVLT